MTKSRRMDHMSWADVQEFLNSGGDLCILAVGALENHGPHLPLGTDTIIIEDLLPRVAEKTGALIGPVIPVGYSPQHLPWPGTITLKMETLALVLREMAGCLVRHGFRRFVIISGHGGNRTALDLAARRLAEEHPDIQCVVVHPLAFQAGRQLREQVETAYGRSLSRVWEAHGGEQETACVLAHDPALVNLAKVPDGEPDASEYLRKVRDPEAWRADWRLKDYSPWGFWGDPRGATAEQGRITLEKLADLVASKINEKWD